MVLRNFNIGFVSTRLAGTDGVSLEVAKWVQVLEELGHKCFFFAGESEWPEDVSYVIPEAHFKHSEIEKITVDLFDDYIREHKTSQNVEKIKNHLKIHLSKFIKKFKLDLLILENVLSIPMNIPLGIAITEVAAETDMPMIGHHHDFSWERSRYAIGAADDYIRAAFPPTLHRISHVVINTFAQRQLSYRTGISSFVIPNVMDFEEPPARPDNESNNVRKRLGINDDDYLLLQPTRVVPRKRIEQAVELARRLDLPCSLIISHASGDEGDAYAEYLKEYIRLLGVNVYFAGHLFENNNHATKKDHKLFSLADAYHQADIITYPSSVEGFGNAFLETIYYKKPIVMCAYEIYKTDIRPKGFDVIDFEDFVTQDVVERTRKILQNPGLVQEMVNHNYEIAAKHFSYSNLERMLVSLLITYFGN